MSEATNRHSDDDEDVGEQLLEEFRSLFNQRRSTTNISTSSMRRKSSHSPQQKAKVLESCLFDLDKQKDVMLETLTALEQNSADQILQLNNDLIRARKSAEEWEQRSNEEKSRVVEFQQDVHALVNILSLAFHSGQWKFASTDFRTVTADMLPPTGSSSKEGMRISLLEKQLSDRGRKIQSLQQELVSGTGQQRLLKDQVVQRDLELEALRQSLASNQEQLATAQKGLEDHEREAGSRHTSLMDEVARRDDLLGSLRADNERLQQLHDGSRKSSMENSEEVGKLQINVDSLTANLEVERERSSKLRGELEASQKSVDDLQLKLVRQDEQVKGLMERLNSQISELQENVAVVEAKYKRACVETAATRAELTECCSSLENAQADAALYHDQLLDCRAKLEQWETSVVLMRDEHGAELSDRDQLITQLREQMVGVSERANEQIVDKATGSSRLQSQVSQLEAEKSSLLQKSSQNDEHVGQLQVSVESLQQENKLCHEQIVKLEEEKASLSRKAAVLNDRLNKEQSEVDSLADAKASLQATIDRLQEQVIALESAEYDKVELGAEMESLQRKLEVAQSELMEKEESLERQHADLIDMESTCARHKDMVQARDEEIKRLKAGGGDGDFGNAELEQKVDELELQILEMKDDMSNTNCLLQQTQDDAEQWKLTYEASEANVARFKVECERVRDMLVLRTEELQKAQQQLAEVERDHKKMLQDVQSDRDQAIQLQIEVNLLRHHRSEVEESLTRELESLRSHSSFIAKADQLSSELTSANQELTQLRRSLASAEEEHDKIIGKLRMEQDQSVKMQARCIAAETALRKVGEAHEASRQEAQSAEEQELHQVKQANDVLTAELTQRQAVVDVLRKEIDELKVQFRLNMHELKLKRRRVQQIDQDMDAQRLQNSVLKEKIMAQERQQTMLEVALEKSQEEREKLSHKITELVSASRHSKVNNSLSSKANDLEDKVLILTNQLSDSESKAAVLEAELSQLRSEQNSADDAHHQLVSQLHSTVSTLGNQLDRVTLRNEGAGDVDDDDDEVDV